MPSGVQVIGLDECKRDLDKLTKDLINGKGVFTQFFRWWGPTVAKAWNRVKATGGTFRGVKWDGMKPQYTRKDGTVVEAWGGVPRVRKGHGLKRKGGNVKGKKRPSGTRVKQSSVMMKDTGQFVRDVTGWPPMALTDRYLDVGTSLEHGEHQDKRRPVIFWQPNVDEVKLGRIYDTAADLAIRKRGFS